MLSAAGEKPHTEDREKHGIEQKMPKETKT